MCIKHTDEAARRYIVCACRYPCRYPLRYPWVVLWVILWDRPLGPYYSREVSSLSSDVSSNAKQVPEDDGDEPLGEPLALSFVEQGYRLQSYSLLCPLLLSLMLLHPALYARSFCPLCPSLQPSMRYPAAPHALSYCLFPPPRQVTRTNVDDSMYMS